MTIKWLKLKRIAEKILDGKEVAFIATTRMPDDLVAGTEVRNDAAIIVMNMAYVKGIEDVFQALAHELAHAITGSAAHDERFRRTMEDLVPKIKGMYYEERG